jgi:RecG-like helicase
VHYPAKELSVARWWSALTRTQDQMDAGELSSQAVAEGADVIATCERGRPVTVCGTIRSVTLRPRVNVPTLEAEVYDGSGHMTLVWLGRRRLSGVDVGRSITAHGRVTCPHGSPMMFNPSYRLHPASVEAER